MRKPHVHTFTGVPSMQKLAIAVIACVLWSSTGTSQTPSPAPFETVGAFMDSVIGVEIREYGVPGVVVTVVRDGRVIFAKGYGVADRRTGRPMSAEQTVLRVGSVSKPVTALAVIQLAERGAIDLDAPAGKYVGALLAGPGARRVTVRDLLTHTSGIDTRLNGTMAPTAGEGAELERYLGRDLPPVVHAPGEVFRYSNHGYALLGRIVEVASGEPFDAYMARHVLGPAGMRSSGYRLEGDLARRAAVGYARVPGAPRPVPVLHPRIGPAAGLATTGADMGRLMVALLDSGAVPGGRLYSPATARLHLGRRFAMHPAMPGNSLGFFETVRRGVRGVGHSGGVPGFMSGVYLWPDRRTGLFVSDNGADGDVVQVVYTAFVNRFLAPVPPRVPIPPPGAAARARRVAGSYRLASLSVRTLERAGTLRRGDLRVGARDDGTLTAYQQAYVERSPGVYQVARGNDLLAFLPAARGRPALLVTSDPFGGNLAWERVPWYATAMLHQVLATLCLFGLASVPWLRPRTRPTLSPPKEPRAVRTARLHRRLVAAGYLAFLAATILAFRSAGDAGLTAGIPLSMRAALALGAATTLLAAGLPWTGWRLRRAGAPSAEVALHAATVVIAGTFAVLLWTWNLLGFRFG